ncbi:MAG: tryptophan synthase subunit beta [Chloroflexi bacterium]|nr:tryptophan synthase subunit beta [Chloroflexota bacterium]
MTLRQQAPATDPAAAVGAGRPSTDQGAARRHRSVVHEIAARRRSDLVAELGDRGLRALGRLAATAPDPRPVALRLARPGLHVITEIKRRSPSAGALIDVPVDVADRARAYAAGGASMVSVLVEPHWFGGSVEDLRTARGAIDLPVLAKEFVVDDRQLPLLRAAGADAVLLLAAIHRPATLRRLVRRALDLGLEPLLEVHDARELEAALTTDARLIGVNNRDLRTLRVDTTTAEMLRAAIPDDRIVIAESGVREPALLRRWRALGVDAALIGEDLMRQGTDAEAITARVAAFVAAGTVPGPGVDPAADERIPLVKICGVTDAAGMAAAIAAGADMVGLNLVPGGKRALREPEAAALIAQARRSSLPGAGPRIVGVFADQDPADVAAIAARLGLDLVQLHGAEPPEALDVIPLPVIKAVHLPGADTAVADAAAAATDVVARADAYRAKPNLEAILLDTSDPSARGGTGRRADTAVAAEVARQVPVILAGGLHAGNVTGALLAIPAIGVDTAGGVEGATPSRATRSVPARPVKDPVRVAMFTKRARAARRHRPNTPFGPAPVHAGLLEVDGAGRWGMERDFGGRYVPETLMAALVQLEEAWAAIRHDPVFWAELDDLLAHFAGRPTALYRADRLAGAVLAEAARLATAAGRRTSIPSGIRLYLKREDLAHTGAHKINNALGQALLTRRLGKSRVIAETGAGQHGVATATACALLGLPCVVFMGEEDIRRQAPNVLRMRALGAEVQSVTSGTATLKDAVNEAMRDWVTNVSTTHYVLGSAMGPHPYPTMVRDLQRRIGDEAAGQLRSLEGRLPDLALACVGGGSNAIGLLSRFIGEPSVRLAVSEAAGDGIETGRHAAAIAGGTAGILHGSRSLMLQDRDGQVIEAISASAGLDYPGVGPQLAALAEAGRIEVATATDREAVAAMRSVTRTEGILPALETSHAVAALPKLVAGLEGGGPLADGALVLVGFSGRGDKDMAALERFADVDAWEGVR